MSDLANFLASFNNDEPIVTDSRISGGGRLIDADTAQTEEGVRVRFPNVNAREVDTFDPAKGLFKNSLYKVAGKTGTALVANGNKGYADKIYQSSFAGYFPADNPQYTL